MLFVFRLAAGPRARQLVLQRFWISTGTLSVQQTGSDSDRVMADEDEASCDHIYKIVLVGDATVGKTHLLSRYVKGTLPKAPTATIGVEFATRTVPLAVGGTVKAQIWDTAGQERYRAITRAHYRRAAGAVLVYDVTRQLTFQSCHKWVEEVREGATPDTVIMLVGNKVDLVEQDPSTRQVYHDAAVEFARQNGLLFSEASAVTSLNVHQIFDQLLQEIYSRAPKVPREMAATKPVGLGDEMGGGIQIAARSNGGSAGLGQGGCGQC